MRGGRCEPSDRPGGQALVALGLVLLVSVAAALLGHAPGSPAPLALKGDVLETLVDLPAVDLAASVLPFVPVGGMSLAVVVLLVLAAPRTAPPRRPLSARAPPSA